MRTVGYLHKSSRPQHPQHPTVNDPRTEITTEEDGQTSAGSSSPPHESVHNPPRQQWEPARQGEQRRAEVIGEPQALIPFTSTNDVSSTHGQPGPSRSADVPDPADVDNTASRSPSRNASVSQSPRPSLLFVIRGPAQRADDQQHLAPTVGRVRRVGSGNMRQILSIVEGPPGGERSRSDSEDPSWPFARGVEDATRDIEDHPRGTDGA